MSSVNGDDDETKVKSKLIAFRGCEVVCNVAKIAEILNNIYKIL